MTNQTEYTATDLRNGTCTHGQFYEQFANQQIIELVSRMIGTSRIKNSNCQHFNDIPLKYWDNLNLSIKNLVDRAKFKRLYNTTYGPQDKDNFIWCLSASVCIGKAAANIIKRS